MNSSLDNKETLFVFLAALIKKAGGTLEIEEKDLIAVSTNDIMTMKFNKATGTITLSLIELEDGELEQLTSAKPN